MLIRFQSIPSALLSWSVTSTIFISSSTCRCSDWRNWLRNSATFSTLGWRSVTWMVPASLLITSLPLSDSRVLIFFSSPFQTLLSLLVPSLSQVWFSSLLPR